jgi:hypothetical protein
MATLWKKGQENSLTIDLSTDDIYGASGFECIYAKLGSSEQTAINSDDWNEIVKSVEDNNCTADGDTLAGSTRIKVKDTDDNNTVANFKKGDVFKVKDKDIYGYIEEVDTDNNYIIVRNPISDTIADGDELDRVGNTGIYQASLTLNEEGIYTFVASNPSIGLQNEVLKIEVSDYEDKLEKILQAINNKHPRARVYG